MKSVTILSLAFIIMLGSLSCTAQSNKQTETQTTVKSNKIEVYYFHFTRRCMTCNAVETESKSALHDLYPELLKNGTITFTSINLDEATSKPVADKCKAAGQSLLVISGDKRVDLTSQGFMNAVNNPDKLREEIKKAIDPILASK